MSIGPLLTSVLARYGLESLTDWATEAVVQGWSEAEVALQLRDRPEFQQRFPAIFEREKAGLSPISADEYIQYEGFARATARQFGVDITQDEINQSIAGDVSVKEIEDRIGIAAQVVYQTPQAVRDEIVRLWGVGTSTGDMIRYWMDPKQQLPVLQKRFFAAQISAEAQLSRFGTLTADQATRLVEGGVTAENSRAVFGDVAQAEELFEAADDTEADLGMEGKIGAVLGDTAVTSTLERRAARRKASFEGGGEFATGKTGVSGLGSANR